LSAIGQDLLKAFSWSVSSASGTSSSAATATHAGLIAQRPEPRLTGVQPLDYDSDHDVPVSISALSKPSLSQVGRAPMSATAGLLAPFGDQVGIPGVLQPGGHDLQNCRHVLIATLRRAAETGSAPVPLRFRPGTDGDVHTVRADGARGALVTFDRRPDGDWLRLIGSAMSSSDRPSALIPRISSTTAPTIITPAPSNYPRNSWKWSVPFPMSFPYNEGPMAPKV
jgi:hypothetical protein